MPTCVFKATVLVAIFVSISGCGSSPVKAEAEPQSLGPPPISPSVHLEGLFEKGNEPVTLDEYEYTLHWRKLMPGGASLNTAGFVHVLAYSDPRFKAPVEKSVHNQREIWDDSPPPPSMAISSHSHPSSKKGTGRERRALTKDEIDAYKRYCDSGVGMTEQDWIVVEKHEYGLGIPQIFISECVPPK